MLRGGKRVVEERGVRGSAAACRSASSASYRNSFTGLVEANRRPFEHKFARWAIGDDSPNDAWLSQTVDPARTKRIGKP